MNVLGFIRNSSWDEMDAVQYYRCYLPLREVDRHDNGITAMVVDDKIVKGLSDDELGGRDVYVMARMYHDECERFIDEIHRRGGKLVLDSDDDLTETYKLVSGRGEAFRKVLGLVDYVTCSTQALAELFSQYTKEAPIVLKNYIDVDWMARLSDKAKRIITDLTIGFSGSPTHWGDWYIPAVPLSRIVKDFDVVPVLHGECPRYLDYVSDRTVKFNGVPYSIYPVLLSQFDIVLCSVDPDDGFNSGKSAVKALECMAVNVVPICSRFGPYIECYEAGAPIVLIAENTRDAWYEAMRDLIQDEPRRLELRSAGRDWVKNNRDMCQSGHEHWSSVYRSIV